MTKLEQILDIFPEENIIKADGFDDAIIGIEQKTMRLIYSVQIIIEILEETMSTEDAIEHINYNIIGSHIENGPIFCTDI
jgi:hypothetical protein